jgi:hypothetical protein
VVSLEVAAIGAALLLAGVAVFQAALALGAPWGEMAYGGRVETIEGVLPARYRASSAFALFVLLFAAWVILARADVVSEGLLSDGFVRAASWVIAGYLVLNTVMNATARTSVERWAMGSATAIAAVLSFVVAAG